MHRCVFVYGVRVRACACVCVCVCVFMARALSPALMLTQEYQAGTFLAVQWLDSALSVQGVQV